jgi:hypothetical protein
MAKPKNVAWIFAAALVTVSPTMAQSWDYHGNYNPNPPQHRGGFYPSSQCPGGVGFLGRCAPSMRGIRPFAPPNAERYECVPDSNGTDYAYGQRQTCRWIFRNPSP